MKIFFCGGLPKSGTTLLQRILDLHPEVGCNSEDNLEILARNFIKLHVDYNKKLLTRAERIGSDKCTLINQDIFIKSFFDLIENIAINRNEGSKFVGISDNHFLLSNLKSLLEYFKTSKAILIFRNPIDTALSTWDHNQRLFKKENFEKHLDLLRINGELNIEKYVLERSRIWNEEIKKIHKQITESQSRTMIIIYEELCAQREFLLKKIFKFLGCNLDKNIISKINNNSSIQTMRKNSPNPEFFSKGRLNFGFGELKLDIIEEALEVCNEGMSLLKIERPKY